MRENFLLHCIYFSSLGILKYMHILKNSINLILLKSTILWSWTRKILSDSLKTVPIFATYYCVIIEVPTTWKYYVEMYVTSYINRIKLYSNESA